MTPADHANTGKLAHIERYATNESIALPQTHRMLPVEDVLALVNIAKAAREFVREMDETEVGDYDALRDALAALDGKP